MELRSVPWRALSEGTLLVGMRTRRRQRDALARSRSPRGHGAGAAAVAARKRQARRPPADHRRRPSRGRQDVGSSASRRDREGRNRAGRRHALHAAPHPREPMPLRRIDRPPSAAPLSATPPALHISYLRARRPTGMQGRRVRRRSDALIAAAREELLLRQSYAKQRKHTERRLLQRRFFAAKSRESRRGDSNRGPLHYE